MATQAELIAWREELVKARASGLARVVIRSPQSHEEIEYRSDSEMAAALASIDRQIAELEGRPSVTIAPIRTRNRWQ
jgi:hypothetical protein